MRCWNSLIAAAALMCAIPWMGAAVHASEFYVSPKGKDSHKGTKRSPFQTIQRAQAEVRKQTAEGLREPVTVFLREGVYELSEPLVFGPQDGGTDTFAVTYKAFPGETVVLSGGRQITKWKKSGDWKKGDKGRWIAELPDVKAGKWFFRQLTVNDQRATRDRWPNEEGALHVATVDDEVRRFTFDRPLPKESLGGQDAEMVVYEHWSVTRGLVTASDEKQLTVATPMGWIGHGECTTATPGKPVFIENVRAFLDQPGEWSLDRSSGVLSYLAAEGENPSKPSTTTVTAPVLEQILRITGTKGKPVRNLRFEGLRFEHTNFPLPSIGYRETQAAHYGTKTTEKTLVQPVAIECVYASNCAFERCGFAHLGASGIGLGQGCTGNRINACRIEDIGGNGVMIGWRGAGKLTTEGLDADWSDPSDAPVSNTVSNCEITRCGAESTGGVGVWAAFSAGTRIAHNHIHEMPYTGISIGFKWDASPTTQERCIVEYNHIHDAMRKLADGGGIYSLGFQPGTVLRGNHIHNVHRSAFCTGAPNNGFFVDQGSKAFLFERNVVYDTAGEPIRFNLNERNWHEWKDNFLGAEDSKKEGALEVIRSAGPKAPTSVDAKQP
jgi:hypothetical protein